MGSLGARRGTRWTGGGPSVRLPHDPPMTRRSTSQRTIDNGAFPILVLIHVPGNGLGRLMDDIHSWCRDNLPPGDFAHHSGGSFAFGGDATAWYFRRVEDAAAFLAANPLVELADGSASRAYTSPAFPLGRV